MIEKYGMEWIRIARSKEDFFFKYDEGFVLMGVVECMCSLQKELDLAAAFCFVEATRSGVEEWC